MSRIDALIADLMSGRISRREFVRQSVALGAASATLGLTARNAFADSDILVGFSFPSFEHFRWAHDRAYFEKRANELGMKYIIQGAEEDPAKQDAQVEAMLSQGIKALVIIPVNIDAGKTLVERVKTDNNIPIISYNYVIPSSKLDYWTARDNYLVGEIQAKYALEKAEKGNWAIVSGPSGVDVARQKTEGAMRVLQPHIDSGGVKNVSHEWHDASGSEGGLSKIENALTQNHNDLKAVIANEDGLALGSLRALTEQGLAGKVFVSGEDVFPEVARELVKGNISISAWTDLIQMGESAANAAYALAKGQKPDANDKATMDGAVIPGMRIQSRGVTKDNLAEFLKLTDWLKPADVGL